MPDPLATTLEQIHLILPPLKAGPGRFRVGEGRRLGVGTSEPFEVTETPYVLMDVVIRSAL